MMMIPTKDYLDYALDFTEKEIARRDFLMEWLPEEIVDAHTHSNLVKHVGCLEEAVRNHMMSTFPGFTLEQSCQTQEHFYPGKNVRSLRFALPFKGIDHKAANNYLLENTATKDRVALCGIPTDVDYTIKMLRREEVAGLKAYNFFFNPPAEKIYQFFKPAMLEEAQALGVPIILHLPRIITLCKEELRTLVRDFPRLTVVLCHLGLPELPVPGLNQAYREFAQHENIFMDTALVPTKEVVTLAIRYFGVERIVYGSDEPLYMVRAKPYINPRLGERLVTEYTYHWVDQKEHNNYGHLAKGVMHLHWQCLSALKETIEALPIHIQDKARRLIFRDTAKEVYGF